MPSRPATPLIAHLEGDGGWASIIKIIYLQATDITNGGDGHSIVVCLIPD